ncbi:MAG TPA: DNA replication/repair protein RecF [Chromatiales bacterium]|nr:DNA replication/repair protein RecF [Chromatiales bacterium]
MAVTELQVRNLRCLSEVTIEPDPGLNLITGPNASGKTSLLEAIYILGRGRSFRAPRLSAVVRTGQSAAVVFAQLRAEQCPGRLGIEFGNQGLRIQIDGETGGSMADLIQALPVQLIDPEVHELIQGGPGQRRRFMDWGVFHVKHEFLAGWRRFRRALQQRNAALRQSSDWHAIQAWDSDLLAGAQVVDRARSEYISELAPIFSELAAKILNVAANMQYRAGWVDGQTYPEALIAGFERDRALGSTQTGPHRAELVLTVDDSPARHRLSRGQQKMLAACLILAQNALVGSMLKKPMLLLVDEPAAELDAAHLDALIHGIAAANAQVFMTALSDHVLPVPGSCRTFHVEHGQIPNLL